MKLLRPHPGLLLASYVAAALLVSASRAGDMPTLDCNSTFPPSTSVDSLRERFGARNVASVDVDVGEGIHESGTVLFAESPQRRLEFIWKDKRNQRDVRLVRSQGEAGAWRTIHGLTLGTDLRTLEKVNGVPFELAGFDWDYSGTVTSWAGGLLDDPFGVCSMTVRLAPELHDDDPVMSQWHDHVIGDRTFSSNHPAMQELNPRIYSIEFSY